MDPHAKVLTVWIAYAIGIVVTGTPFAGVIMAYVCRNTNDQPGVAGHNAMQIKAFWYGFGGWIIAIAIMAGGVSMTARDTSATDEGLVIGGLLLIIGILFAIVVQIAFTIFSIVGIVRAAKKTNWPGAQIGQNPAAVFG